MIKKNSTVFLPKPIYQGRDRHQNKKKDCAGFKILFI